MRQVVRFMLVTVVVACCSVWSLAQGGNPPARTKESGKTSGHGMTAVEQVGPAEAESEIHELDQQMRQAALKGDASILEKYLASNYVGVGADGKEVTRDQAIQTRKSGAVKYEIIDLRDTKVRLYHDTAVVDHLATVKGSRDGQPFGGDYHVTFVWVTQGGRWKLASFNSVPVVSTSVAAK